MLCYPSKLLIPRAPDNHLPTFQLPSNMSVYADEKAFGKHEMPEDNVHDVPGEFQEGSSSDPKPVHTALKRQMKNRHIAMIRCEAALCCRVVESC